MTTKVVPAPEIWIVHYKQRETVWHYKPSSLAPDCEAHRYVLAAPAVEGERQEPVAECRNCHGEAHGDPAVCDTCWNATLDTVGRLSAASPVEPSAPPESK